jgi:TatD-related deoxyribonuclease
VALPADLPVVDHHCHLSPGGEGVDAARRFREAGGTHLFLTTHNWNHASLRAVDDYRVQFEGIEDLGKRIRAETSVGVSLVVAPYPVDLVESSTTLGLPKAVELQMQAMDLAGQWVREHRAIALGEVGWPHFPVTESVFDAAQEVFRHALEVAHDVDCPAVVHCEDLAPDGYRALGDRARAAGLRPERLVKHYARTYVPAGGRSGVTPSFLARRDVLTTTMDDPGPWFLETDFLDDPRRPGAVLDIATVPRRAAAFSRASPDQVSRLRIPFVESVRHVYGFVPEPSAGASR